MTVNPRVRAVLQAGGRGERMLDIGGKTPKPLLKVGGTPMVERLLRQLLKAGVRNVTVITGWMGDRVESHLLRIGRLPRNLNLSFIREERARGNVGSLADLPRDGRQVLLAFGDLVTDLDFAALLSVHLDRRADVTLTSHYETHRLSLGELVVHGQTVAGYQEKPEKRFLICSGIAVFEPRVIELVPADRPVGISDLVLSALSAHCKVTHWTHEAFWMDINSKAELARARRLIGSRAAK